MICAKLFYAKNKLEKEECDLLFKYALGLSASYPINNIVRRRQIQDIKYFLDYSYYSLSCLWRSVVSVLACGEDVKKACTIFGSTVRDVMYILDDCLDKKEISVLVRRKTKLNRLKKTELWDIAFDNMRMIDNLVEKKLRFVYLSNCFEKDDFVNDTFIAVLRYLYKRDWQTKTFLVNGVRKCIVNHIVNLIYRYTAQCRNRLRYGDNGWENIIVPEELGAAELQMSNWRRVDHAQV